MTIEDDHPEDLVWKSINPDDIWVMDKLILARKLGYICGPTGMDVPEPNWYIVRPCVNMLGLGLGTERVWLDKYTLGLPVGFFWCEEFKGRHLSVDYHKGVQHLCIEGHKSDDTFTKWDKWIKTDDKVPLPKELKHFTKYEWLNVEYINGKAIEVHLRHNEDFVDNISEFIPVWEGQDITPPKGYRYRDYPDLNGRIGAFIK